MYPLSHPKMQYVFEHMTEFYPHSVVWCGGQPQRLEERHRDRIAAVTLLNSKGFPTALGDNERIALAKLIEAASVDELIIPKETISYTSSGAAKAKAVCILQCR